MLAGAFDEEQFLIIGGNFWIAVAWWGVYAVFGLSISTTVCVAFDQVSATLLT